MMDAYKNLCEELLLHGDVGILEDALQQDPCCVLTTSSKDRRQIEAGLGQSLLHIVLKCKLEDRHEEEIYKLVETLVNAGIDCNTKDTLTGRTPLHYAIKNKENTRLIALLLNANNDAEEKRIHVADNEDKTPLHLLTHALEEGHVAACREQHGGSAVTFGRSDLQLGYTTEKIVQPTPKRVKFHGYNGNDLVFVAAARFHSLALDKDGALYTWGQGNGGRLGHGNEDTYILPTRIESLFKNGRKIIKVSAGCDHSLALCDSGDLFSWGVDKCGQLGLGNTNNGRVLSPRRVKMNGAVSDIAASANHSICVTKSGSVFTWGANDHGQLGFRARSNETFQSTPYRMDVLHHRELGHAVLCAAAEGVSCLVTESGKVWQWGRGSPSPTRVLMKKQKDDDVDGGWQKARDPIRIVCIASGPHHSCAVSEDGDLYTWGTYAALLGHAFKGQDRNSSSHTTVGLRVEALHVVRSHIVSVSCSKRHTSCIDRSGQLWVWGYGEHGILGDSVERRYQPSPMRAPSLRRVAHCCAADSHTIALVAPFKPQLHDTNTSLESNEIQEEEEELQFAPEPEELQFGEVDSDSDVEAASAVKQEAVVYEPESLAVQASRVIASIVNVWNVLSIWEFSDCNYQTMLSAYCEDFVKANLDGIVVARKFCEKDLANAFGCRISSLDTSSEHGTETTSPKNLVDRRKSKKSLKTLRKQLRGLEEAQLKFQFKKVKQQKKTDKQIVSLRSEIEKLELDKKEKEPICKPTKEEPVASDLYCKHCDVRVPDKLTMVDHVSGKRHRKMMAKLSSHSNAAKPVTQSLNHNQSQYVTPKKGIAIPGRNGRQTTKQHTEESTLGSSMESLISWGSPIATPKQQQTSLRSIMLEESRRPSESSPIQYSTVTGGQRTYGSLRPSASNPNLASSATSDKQPWSSVTPVKRRGELSLSVSPVMTPLNLHSTSATSEKFALSSFIKDKKRSPHSPTPKTWSSPQAPITPLQTPLSLSSIQQEQLSNDSVRSLQHSSWGFQPQSINSVSAIQQEQTNESLERSSRLLALRLQQEEIAKLQEARRRRARRRTNKKNKGSVKDENKGRQQSKVDKKKDTRKKKTPDAAKQKRKGVSRRVAKAKQEKAS